MIIRARRIPPRSGPRSSRPRPLRARSATAPRRSAPPFAVSGLATYWWLPAKVMKRARSSASAHCRSRTTRSSVRPCGVELMSAFLWTASDLAGLPGARLAGDFRPITGVSIDTRTLVQGDLFFALRDVRDGHNFVGQALTKGAAAAVVEIGRAAEFGERGALVAVPDVLDAMRALGSLARARMNGGVVAVTGSVGKTGTKEALKLVLSRFGATHASAASYNNHWGVPLTLARMPAESAFGVFEIGMNHEGEIAPLTRMVRPHVAIVTTIEPVHIAHFRSILGIADAKGEIFAG